MHISRTVLLALWALGASAAAPLLAQTGADQGTSYDERMRKYHGEPFYPDPLSTPDAQAQDREHRQESADRDRDAAPHAPRWRGAGSWPGGVDTRHVDRPDRDRWGTAGARDGWRGQTGRERWSPRGGDASFAGREDWRYDDWSRGRWSEPGRGW
jgi:hypothetical protein